MTPSIRQLPPAAGRSAPLAIAQHIEAACPGTRPARAVLPVAACQTAVWRGSLALVSAWRMKYGEIGVILMHIGVFNQCITPLFR